MARYVQNLWLHADCVIEVRYRPVELPKLDLHIAVFEHLLDLAKLFLKIQHGQLLLIMVPWRCMEECDVQLMVTLVLFILQ